jgi:cysteine desulfurase / selenocysteine lyase
VAIDVDRARRETPGCQTVLHFNNAGAALMPQAVLHAVVGHVQREALLGGYEAAEQAHAAVEHVYDAAATLLGCHRAEIAFVENATRAWDMAFYAIPLGPGDRILTAMAEYASNYLAFLQVARQTGATIEVIPNDAHGQISIAALRQAIDERVKLIAITHVPTNSGLVNPAAAVGEVARQAGVFRAIQFSSVIPIRCKTAVGWAAKRRQAAAMLVYPAQRISPMAVLRSAAMTCGIWPHRPWERSSSKVTARTQCD